MPARRPAPAGIRTVLVAHPSAELYGSDRVMLESVSAFVEAGWRVVVALPGRGPLIQELEGRGAAVVATVSPVLRKSALRPRGFVQLARDVALGTVQGLRLMTRERPSVVYVSTLTIPLWVALARIRRTPVVAHVHEAEGSARLLVRRVLAGPLLLATRIVANSEFSAEVLRISIPRLGPRITVVYNAVPGPVEAVVPRLALDGGLRLLYVGRLSPRKGVDVAVAAVGRLTRAGHDVRLDLLGSVFAGYEWYEERLRTQVRAAGLEDRVRFHGFHREVWPFLAATDVVLVPSIVDEPFGNTAVEAVLAARPVIVSETSGLREAAHGYVSAQQVTPGDATALASAILEVQDHWPQYAESVLADAVLAAGRHSPARYRGRLAEILTELRVPPR